MNPPNIDPTLIGTSSVRAPTSRAVSTPVVPAVSRGARRCVRMSSPAFPSTSEWSPSEEDVLAALQVRVESLEDFSYEQEKQLAVQDTKLVEQNTKLAEQDTEISELRVQVSTFKRQLGDAGFGADDVGADADDEGQKKKKKKKKGIAAGERILTEGKATGLTGRQKQVRRELANLVSRKMKRLSGTPDNSPIPTENLPPGEYTLDDGKHVLIPEFARDVTDLHNERLIDQAAHLVFNEQKDIPTHADVKFTEKDVQWLGKAAFRSWKTNYVRATDEAAKEKATLQAKKNTRSQRKRQKKTDRLEMNEEYLVKFGADPTPLLLLDWMSDYLSSLEDGNEDEKRYHRAKMETAAGFTPQHQGGDAVIWERVRPGFRSAEVNTVFSRLDALRKGSKRDSGKKSASHARVDLGRVNNKIPFLPPFPFMVDETWHATYVVGQALQEPFEMKNDDPVGFGTKEIRADANI